MTDCAPSSDAIEGILESLQKNKIVDSNLELIDVVTKVNTTLFISKTTYYIYENQNGKFIAINYDESISSNNDYDYTVVIYFDVSTNDVEYIDSYTGLESYYTYQGGNISEDNKYNFDDEEEYFIYEKKPLFSKTKYVIEKAS